MITYTIKKGRHYSTPRLFKLWFKSKPLSYRISFDQSCRYDIGAEQGDINKLFGIGFIWHHQDSARFGWVYNKEADKIDIYAYCYVDGKRLAELFYSCGFDRSYDFTIEPHFGSYIFKVRGTTVYTKEIKHFHTKNICYPLMPYFGGTRKAPRDMHIHMKKL